MLILLVDDERMVRVTVRSMIEQLYPHEHKFIEAKNGIEAINLILNNNPDLAFVDYKIPIKNGIEVIRETSKYTKSLKWVILSGYEKGSFKSELEGVKITDFLLKPASLSDIKEAVEKSM